MVCTRNTTTVVLHDKWPLLVAVVTHGPVTPPYIRSAISSGREFLLYTASKKAETPFDMAEAGETALKREGNGADAEEKVLEQSRGNRCVEAGGEYGELKGGGVDRLCTTEIRSVSPSAAGHYLVHPDLRVPKRFRGCPSPEEILAPQGMFFPRFCRSICCAEKKRSSCWVY